jgi:sugar lactone lactonase YvrE
MGLTIWTGQHYEAGSIKPNEREYAGLADRFEGKRLNSPNDVVVKSDDSIWFTDVQLDGRRSQAWLRDTAPAESYQ